jgi:hypothetical protein
VSNKEVAAPTSGRPAIGCLLRRQGVHLSRARLTTLIISACVSLPVLASAPLARVDGPSPDALESALERCLLPAPAGYDSLPQTHTPQRNPVPLTPDERSRLLFPQVFSLRDRSMGWAIPDPEYWSTIPSDCRALPEEMESLPVLRFNNIEIRGEREIRFRAYWDYDQWFLRDQTRDLNAVMAIQRETKRVYFFEYRLQAGKTVFVPGKESCYACHVSGPRLIRTYDLPKVDRSRLDEFNRRLLSYGACDFGGTVDPDRLGKTVSDARCAGCHDGKTRGKLYPLHLLTMANYVETLKAMPPASPLAEDEAQMLLARVFEQRPVNKLARRSAGRSSVD